VTGLRVEGLRKSFGDTRVLDGLDLTVRAGTTAVLGPSGCGKTTLLRLVAGFLQPDAGTVEIGGRVVAGGGRSTPARLRRVGYVPQEGALFPHLDVTANVGFGLPRAARRGARVREVLDLVELPTAVAGRFPHELSGGQQQRVALARALAPKPALVLLDEPFSSLDAGLREDTGRAVARALRASGATAVLVTHDQGEALSLADQVAVMRAGRLVQAASPHDLYRAPADADVARFVGGAAILPGQVRDGIATCALGDLAVEGTCADGEVQVLVRPEQVRIDGSVGAAEGRVGEVSFYGHDAAVLVDLLPDGPSVVARIPGLDAPGLESRVKVGVAGRVVVFATNP
jgi:iron(III) transport system ATP-binding protein